MAHHEGEPTAIGHVLEVLTEHGLDAMAQAMETLFNEAMKLERATFLGAAPGRGRHPNALPPARPPALSGCSFARGGCRVGAPGSWEVR